MTPIHDDGSKTLEFETRAESAGEARLNAVQGWFGSTKRTRGLRDQENKIIHLIVDHQGCYVTGPYQIEVKHLKG